MNKQSGHSQIGTIVILTIIGLLVGFCIGKTYKKNTTTTPIASNTATMTSNGQTASQVQFQMAMRKLWTDHVVWTRDYIISAIADSPDKGAAANRLMQNQDDIGTAVAVYYGKDAGNKLTGLLKDHISIAVRLVDEAKNKQLTQFASDNEKWRQNGKDIAAFLATANPNWSQDDLTSMMLKHLDTTAAELTARLTKAWPADVAAYDAVYNHILMMADTLSDGIIRQFPDKFK